jgi:hypothetical protein
VLDCRRPEAQPPARNGQPVPAELAKRLIRCAMGENPSPPGGQGATRVDISAFSVGAPHRWNLYSDTGGGSPETLVYPVRVTFTSKTFYQEQNKLTADRQQLFECHVTTGRWLCGPDEILNPGAQSSILVKKG